MSAIYLDLMSPLNSCSLPPGIERAALHTPVYMILQPLSSTAFRIAAETGKLLPYLLTLTFDTEGGYFLLLNSAFTNSYPLDSRVLCVVRTFLFLTKATSQSTALPGKYTDFY